MIFDNDTGKSKDPVGEKKALLKISGKEAKIDAKFKVEDSIMIDCDVKGELKVEGEVFIDSKAEVNANVKTKDAYIKGKFKGNLEATNDVEVDSSSDVSGKIKTDSIIINKGANFDGKVSRLKKK